MKRFAQTTPVHAAVALLALSLTGCSTIEGVFSSGDKSDYQSAAAKNQPLEVPPDLTQLARDSRYMPQNGVISASVLTGANAASTSPATATSALASTPGTVAPSSLGDAHIERAGNQRWLATSAKPEQVWPLVLGVLAERKIGVVSSDQQTGVIETEWYENRANIKQDAIRSVLGRLVDSLYSTGERDKYRIRVERTERGTEVYVAHRGLEEVYTSAQKDTLTWRTRGNDPQLEADLLVAMMVKLGAPAPVVVAAAPAASAAASSAVPTAILPVTTVASRAKALTGQAGAALQIDENFDRAWRRVGLALDRTGFTVEDRDRSQGLYFVRFIDPKLADQEEPGLFARIFQGKSAEKPSRYRLLVKPSGSATTVSILDAQGAPETTEIGKHIVSVLLEDLH